MWRGEWSCSRWILCLLIQVLDFIDFSKSCFTFRPTIHFIRTTSTTAALNWSTDIVSWWWSVSPPIRWSPSYFFPLLLQLSVQPSQKFSGRLLLSESGRPWNIVILVHFNFSSSIVAGFSDTNFVLVIPETTILVILNFTVGYPGCCDLQRNSKSIPLPLLFIYRRDWTVKTTAGTQSDSEDYPAPLTRNQGSA